MNKELPDFDTLKDLAKNDPDSLERLRQEHVAAIINRAPPEIQQRLRGLQFQIDAQRKIHSSPMAACIKISQMMYESFTELRVMLNEVGSPKESKATELEPKLAEILEFRQPCPAID